MPALSVRGGEEPPEPLVPHGGATERGEQGAICGALAEFEAKSVPYRDQRGITLITIKVGSGCPRWQPIFLNLDQRFLKALETFRARIAPLLAATTKLLQF